MVPLLSLVLCLPAAQQTLAINESVALATLGDGAADHATLAVNGYGDVLVANHAFTAQGVRLVEGTLILSQGDLTFEVLPPYLLGDPSLGLIGNDSCTKPDVVALADDSFVVVWPRGDSTDTYIPGRLEAARVIVRDASGVLLPTPQVETDAPGAGYVIDPHVVGGDGGVMPDLVAMDVTDPGACTVVYAHSFDVHEGVTKKFREFDLRACRIDFSRPPSSSQFLDGPEVLVPAVPLDEYLDLPYIGGLVLPDVVLDDDGNLVVANEESLIGPHFGMTGPARSRVVVRRFRPFDHAQELELIDELVLSRGTEDLRPRRPNLSSCIGDQENTVAVSWFDEGLEGNLSQVYFQTIPYLASSHLPPVDGFWLGDAFSDEGLSTATVTDTVRACLAVRVEDDRHEILASTMRADGSTDQVTLPTEVDYPWRPAAQLITTTMPSGAEGVFCPITYEGADQPAQGQYRIYFTYRQL